MADNYEIVGQYPTLETLGGTRTRDVQAIQAVTKPHAVYFELRVPKGVFTPAQIGAGVSAQALIFETPFQWAGVEAVEWTQEPDATGNLQDHIILYVTSTSGNSSDFVDIPYTHWTQDYMSAAVHHLRDSLDATEAL